jgi:hypothetical protein
VQNLKKKTYKAKQKDEMTKQPKTYAPTPRFMQDLKCTQCELEAMLEMM